MTMIVKSKTQKKLVEITEEVPVSVTHANLNVSSNRSQDRFIPGDTIRKQIREAASKLSVGMNWKDAAEGEDFWKDVYNRLVAISESPINH